MSDRSRVYDALEWYFEGGYLHVLIGVTLLGVATLAALGDFTEATRLGEKILMFYGILFLLNYSTRIWFWLKKDAMKEGVK